MCAEWTHLGLEAPPGFEPGMEVLQTSALPLGDGAGRTNCFRAGRSGRVLKGATTARGEGGQTHHVSGSEGWSGKRDSNPRLRPWQGRTLPLSYSRPRRKLSVTHGFEARQPRRTLTHTVRNDTRTSARPPDRPAADRAMASGRNPGRTAASSPARRRATRGSRCGSA
jgi:hypothetical protein